MNLWPMAQTMLGGKRVVVHETRVVPSDKNAVSGTIVFADKAHVIAQVGSGAIEFVRVQLEGKKPVRAVDWWMGRGVKEGDVLGRPV